MALGIHFPLFINLSPQRFEFPALRLHIQAPLPRTHGWLGYRSLFGRDGHAFYQRLQPVEGIFLVLLLAAILLRLDNDRTVTGNPTILQFQ